MRKCANKMFQAYVEDTREKHDYCQGKLKREKWEEQAESEKNESGKRASESRKGTEKKGYTGSEAAEGEDQECSACRSEHRAGEAIDISNPEEAVSDFGAIGFYQEACCSRGD